VTRLLASEIRRLTGRRLVFWLLVISIVLVIVLDVLVAVYSNPDAVGNDVMRPTQLWLTRGAAEALGVKRENVLPTISVLTYLLVIVIGASAVGAEYRAGTVTTILTWEPRRIRLLLARLTAAAVVAMVFFLVIHVVFIGGWVLGAKLRNPSAGASADFWWELASVVARGVVIAGVFAAISGALAGIGRNTAAAMGIWFGYLVVVEAIVRSQLPEAVPWFLIPNVAAFYGWETVRTDGYSITAGAGGLRLLLDFAVIGTVAVVVFRRRDVT
jgi:ABC-2 type transport system permease protein